jgi:hypothetical protein
MKLKFVSLLNVSIPITHTKDQCNPSGSAPVGYEEIQKGTTFDAISAKIELTQEYFSEEEKEKYPGVSLEFSGGKTGCLSYAKLGKMIMSGAIKQIS